MTKLGASPEAPPTSIQYDKDYDDGVLKNDLASGNLGENPLQKIFGQKGFFLRLAKHLVSMFKYFFAAWRFDIEDNKRAIAEGKALPTRWANLKNWWKYFGITLIVIVVIVFSLSRIVKPRYRPGVKQHHGINKYGERY